MKRVVLVLAALGILSVSSVMAAPVSYQSVLTGKVASTVSVGTSVTEGQTLVTVETLAGPMAAAKSTVTGTVTAVNVTVGSDVSRDQIVVTVERKERREGMKVSHSWRRYRKAILALFFCTSLTTAQAIDFMPVNDVTTGMEGIAKTVIVGDTISTFDVKVLGVMKDKGPSGHLILAKFSGPVMDQTGGIAHGMSGSPVYINGKLVGAVAYGWGFADGTIGMITPIEDMVKLWNIPYEKNLSKPWDDTQLIPLGTPLMAYGFDAASMDYFKSKLPQYKYETYDTASASGDEIAKPLEAGGSVAALLVDGDLKLGAIGTVTHVDGEKVVAFGHPFLKHGSSNYFMHNASIFTVVKSYNAAFKLGSMGKEIGSVTEDRGAGIAGVSGVISPGIPLRFHLKDIDMGRDRTSSVKVIEDGEMTPTLAATALYNMLNKTLDRSGSGTATISYTITPKGKEHKPLTRTNMFYSSDSISEKAVDEFYNVIDVLMNNRFINYEISDISVETNVTQDKKTAKLIDASASSTVVSPGDTIVVDVTLEPFRGEKVIKQIFFKVPEDQAIGKYTLEVRGGGEIPLPYVLEKQKYNLTDEILRRLKVHKDFDELYDEIQKTDTNNQIVVEFLEDGISLVDEDGSQSVKKAKLKDVESKPMPGDVKKKTGQEDLSSSKDDEKKPEKTAVDTEYIVQGDGQFTIHVMKPADRDKELAKRVKEAKHQIKMERKLELEDQSKKDKTDKAESKKDSKKESKETNKKDEANAGGTNTPE